MEEQCRQEHPFSLLFAHAIAPDDFPENPQTIFGSHVTRLLEFGNET
jgi:hypothetical protein